MSKKIIIIIIAVVILLSGATFFLLHNKKLPQPTVSGDNTAATNEIPIQEKTYTLNPSQEDDKNNIYTDTQYNFSFEYPQDFAVTKFSDTESSDTILVQNKDGKNGFQIFISPFDEPGPITKERVLQDLPDIVMKNPEQRVLKNGIPALIFFSQEESLGETREIWFVNNGYLYQITATKEIDSLVAQIVATWKF